MTVAIRKLAIDPHDGHRYAVLTDGCLLDGLALLEGWRWVRRAYPCITCGRGTRLRDPEGHRQHPSCARRVDSLVAAAVEETTRGTA